MKKKEEFFSKTLVVWLGALICCAFWGSAFPCIKLGYAWMEIEAADTATQILYAGVRFALAGVLSILLGSIISKQFLYPKVKALPKVVWLSLLQTIIQYLFFYIGLAHTSGVKASIIEGVNVFVAIFVAAVLFRQEKLTVAKFVGSIVGFTGVVLVNFSDVSFASGGVFDSLSGGFAVNGEGFIFLSTVAYAFSSVFLKKYSKTENPLMLSGYQFLFGGSVMALGGFVCGGRLSAFSSKAIGMLVWLAMVSAVAYSLWGILLKYNPVSKVAVFGFMNPVFGVLLSALLLKEGKMLGILSIVALLLVCLGIYIVNRPAKQTRVERKEI